jgi:hypothetical protein
MEERERRSGTAKFEKKEEEQGETRCLFHMQMTSICMQMHS